MTRKGNIPQYLSPEYEMVRDAAQELGLSHAVALKMHRLGVLQTALIKYGEDYFFGDALPRDFNEKPEIPPFWKIDGAIDTSPIGFINPLTSKK